MTDDRDDEAAVLATLDRFGDACSRMDVAAALNVFAADDDILLVGSEAGEMARGRDAMEAFLRRVLRAAGGYSWAWDWRTVSHAGSVAWIFAEGTARAGGGPEAVSIPYRVSIVLEMQGDIWRWRLFHGSEPAGGGA